MHTLLLATLMALGASGQQLVDRIAAVVNDEVITLSDVVSRLRDQGRALPDEGPEREAILRQILDELIDRRLIVAAAFDTPFFEIGAADVDAFVRSRLEAQGEQLFQQRLREAGMTEATYRLQVRELLAVNRFRALRFEPFVIVLPEEIAGRYDELYGSLGTLAPSREETEEPIRDLVGREKIEDQMDRWVRAERRKSEVEVLLFRDPGKGNRP